MEMVKKYMLYIFKFMFVFTLIGTFNVGVSEMKIINPIEGMPSSSATVEPGTSLVGAFSVSQNGAGIYTIPIITPPGLGDLQPNLSLNYSSQRADGLLGVGWALGGLSAITRCPQTLAQDGKIHGVDFSKNDRFCLDGQRLIAINGIYGADKTEYRTEINNGSRIISYGVTGSGPSYFTVENKSGHMLKYGNIDISQTSRIFNSNRYSVFTWAISSISDQFENKIIFEYELENSSYRPKNIKYSFNNETKSPIHLISFTYIDRELFNHITSYVAGSKLPISKLLNTIKIYTNNELVYEYYLSYKKLKDFYTNINYYTTYISIRISIFLILLVIYFWYRCMFHVKN